MEIVINRLCNEACALPTVVGVGVLGGLITFVFSVTLSVNNTKTNIRAKVFSFTCLSLITGAMFMTPLLWSVTVLGVCVHIYRNMDE